MIESFKLPVITPETLTGSIVSFNDEYGGLPLKSCTSLITGYQEGSGTPSPQNVRPLHALSSGTLTANSNTYTFTFGQSIYQGSIDWKRGVVVGTHGIVDLGSLTWLYNTQYANPLFYTNLVGAKLTPSAQKDDTLAEIFETYSAREMNTAGVDYAVAISEPYFFSSYNLYIVDSDYTDPTAFKTAMNGVQLAYELATPIEIPLGGINLLTQEGQNNIFCDTGDTEVTHLKVT